MTEKKNINLNVLIFSEILSSTDKISFQINKYNNLHPFFPNIYLGVARFLSAQVYFFHFSGVNRAVRVLAYRADNTVDKATEVLDKVKQKHQIINEEMAPKVKELEKILEGNPLSRANASRKFFQLEKSDPLCEKQSYSTLI